MLTSGHLRFNIAALKFCSVLSLLPLEVNNSEISFTRNRFKLWIWKFLVGISCCHSLFINVRLIQFSNNNSINLSNLPNQVYFHFLCCYVSLFMLSWWKSIFLDQRYEIVSLLNQALEHVIKKADEKDWSFKFSKNLTYQELWIIGTPSMLANQALEHVIGKAHEKDWSLKVLKNLTYQELLIIGIPWMLVVAIAAGIAFFVFENDSPQLIFSVLPEIYQNISIFLLLLVLEILFLVLWIVALYFGFLMQLLASVKCLYELEGIVLKGRSFANMRSIEISTSRLQQTRIFLHFYNLAFNGITSSMKLLSYVNSICFGFFAISSFSKIGVEASNPGILGVVLFNSMVGIDSTIAYSLTFDKAVSIPQKFRTRKADLLWSLQMTSRQLASVDKYQCLKRVIRSCPDLGIQVGRFNTMERTSTLIFLDAVATKVAALLVMNV